MNNNNTLRFQAGASYGVGVDIGGTKIIILVADPDGKVVYRKKVSTSGQFEAIAEIVETSIKEAAIPMSQVAAIGFGVPGIANSDEGVVIDAPALQWNDVPFRQEMQKFFDKPIVLDNDVNCAALGERWIGSAQEANDFVVVAIGTGVGSAIIANGALVKGSNHMAGEVAYLVLEDDVREKNNNTVGQFGLFEQRISGLSLAKHGIQPQHLFERFVAGDERYVPVIDRFIEDLSIGIANMVSLLNPQKVILGGGVSQSLAPILERIRLKVAGLTPIPTMIELSTIGEDAGAFGAAALAFQQAAAAVKEV